LTDIVKTIIALLLNLPIPLHTDYCPPSPINFVANSAANPATRETGEDLSVGGIPVSDIQKKISPVF
jgi:hypothetical protein